MKNVIILLLAVVIGVGIGYFIFGKNNNKAANQMEGHNHSTEMSEPSATKETIYTCSMHPQIRQNEMGICPICEMDLIPVETNASSDPLVFQMTEEAVKISNIQTTIMVLLKVEAKVFYSMVKSNQTKDALQVSSVICLVELKTICHLHRRENC